MYGWRGAKGIPSLLRTVASVYWFAFQTLAGASAIVAMLPKLTQTTLPLVGVSVIFGLIQAGVAVIGYGSLTALSRIALPIKVVAMAYLFVLFLRATTTRTSGLRRSLSYPGGNA